MSITNLIIQQGATFQKNIDLTDSNNMPLSVGGLTANAAIKRDYYANTVLAVFETNLTTGNLSIKLEANVTANLWIGDYVYDVLITDGTTIYRIAEGLVTIDGGVTEVSI